jgi:D-sedoheptulose 7-phosphate isomerase
LKQDLNDPIATHIERSLAALQRTTQDAALLATAREIAAAVIAALRSANKL